MVMRFTALLALALTLCAQNKDANYDEAKVPQYKLPDPLVLRNGQPVKNAKTWNEKRRPELLELFRSEMYGRRPGKPQHMTFELEAIDKQALGGSAIRKEVTVYFTGKKDGPKMNILIYLPAAAKPVPVFLGLNFGPNQTVDADPAIRLRDAWVREGAGKVLVKKAADEKTRGSAASRWQVEKIIGHGYGLAVIYYCDIEPDFDGGMPFGVRPTFFAQGPDAGAAIAAWSWGLSRALDYLETDKDVDSRHVAVFGHSRLGKTSLWAGAEDTRFAMVISNCSGEGGAALSRRVFGEQPHHLNRSFPHWFDANYKKYGNHETDLPFDQHELIALIAPRPVYVATAEEDLWADPRGQFLAEVAAGPVYELLGKKGLGTDQWPGVHQPVMHDIGYHHRAGKHDVTAYDWDQYLAFADMHFGRR
jgi:(4-O-methyl)-D-glucuronate---lignin esterase